MSVILFDLIIFIVFVIFGILIGLKMSKFLFKTQRKMMKQMKLSKYQIHHDFIGLVLIIFSLILRPVWLGVAITGLGFGMLMHHLFTEGFQLITKR
jgi:hypothetical protein